MLLMSGKEKKQLRDLCPVLCVLRKTGVLSTKRQHANFAKRAMFELKAFFQSNKDF